MENECGPRERGDCEELTLRYIFQSENTLPYPVDLGRFRNEEDFGGTRLARQGQRATAGTRWYDEAPDYPATEAHRERESSGERRDRRLRKIQWLAAGRRFVIPLLATIQQYSGAPANIRVDISRSVIKKPHQLQAIAAFDRMVLIRT